MPRDKTANHIKIMAAAKEEFMAYGFNDASMRNIGRRCNMSAAGIYRHCRDKEDLFDQLVSPAVEKINSWIEKHNENYTIPLKDCKYINWKDSEIDMMRDIIYPNMEEYHLLFAKAQGSKYENFLHDITNRSQEQLLLFITQLKKCGYKPKNVSKKELHLLLLAYNTALLEPVIHNYSLPDAMHSLDTIEAFFIPGWKALLDFK